MKVGGQILWNVTPICETSQIYCLMGRGPMKDVWATIERTYYSFWFIGRVSSYTCEGPINNPSIWKESLTWIVPRIRCVRGVNLEGWRTGCRPWGVGDDGRIGNLLEKTQCQKGDISQKRIIYFLQSQMAETKHLGEDQAPENIHLGTAASNSRKNQLDFLGESEGSLPPPHDSFPDAGEALNDFWSMSGNFMYSHHVELRVKLYSPREKPFPIPLKIRWRQQNYTYILGCYARTPHRRLLDGSRDLSGSWTGFTQMTLLEEKASRRIYVVQEERLTRKQLTSRPDYLFMDRTLDEIE